MYDHTDLVRVGVALPLVLALGWLPGYAVARTLLREQGRALALGLAPALGAGGLYAAGQVLTLAHLPVDWRLAAAAGLLAVITLLRRGAVGDLRALRSRQVGLVGAAALLATVTWAAGIGGLGQVPPHDDGYNHGTFIRRIAELHTLDPRIVIPHDVLLGGHAASFYPVALHQQAAVLVQVLHLDVGLAWTLVSLAPTVLALPVGMFALMRVLAPTHRVVAGTAAMVSVVMPGLYSAAWWGGYSMLAGLAMVPAVLTLLMQIGESWTPARVVAAVLALSGLIGVHSSAWSFVLVVAAVLLAADRHRSMRVVDVVVSWLRVGVVAVLSLVLLAPVVAQLSGGLAERQDVVSRTPISLTRSVRALGSQFSPDLTPRSLSTVATVVVCVAIAVCVALPRGRPWVAVWACFAVLFAWLASFPDSVARVLTSTWYSDPKRVAYLVVFLSIPLISFAFSSTLGSRRTGLRLVGVMSSVALLPTVAVATVHMVRDDYRRFSLVGADQRAAFRWLASHVGARDHVLNQHQDGSEWMYALDGVAPIYALKAGAFDDPEWKDATYLLAHATRAGIDPREDELLDTYSIRYVYVGDRVFSTEAPDLTSGELRGACGLREVWAHGLSHVFERVAVPSGEIVTCSLRDAQRMGATRP